MGSASAPQERLTFVGHSTVRLEVGGARLLTDPLLRERLMHLRRHVAAPPREVAEGIDAVLISHLHSDHLDLQSLRVVGTGVRLIVPRGAAGWLARKGFEHVEEVGPGAEVRVGGADVRAVRAEHPSRRWPIGGPAAQPVGFEVRGAHGVYFSGDTGLHAEMADLAGRVDVALLPVWGWGPTLGAGHLDPRGAAEAAALIRPRTAVPVHWGTFFPLGFARRHGHLLRDPPRDFADQVARLAPGVEVRVLEPGESLALTA